MAEEKDVHEEHGLYHGEHPLHAHEHGSMDISEQEKVFNAFVRLSAWTVVLIVLILAFLALTQT